MKTPIRYPGGKQFMRIEDYIDHDFERVVSPFVGGASFELRQLSEGKEVIANDKNGSLINFWSWLKKDKEKLVQEIKSMLPIESKEIFKETLASSHGDCIRSAASFYCANKCAFNAIMSRSAGYSRWCAERLLNEASINKLLRYDLSLMSFSCLDFTEFLGQVEFLGSDIVFCDPPYFLGYEKERLYGKSNEDYLHRGFDHRRLKGLLDTLSVPVYVTYNDCEFIREMYNDWSLVEIPVNYRMAKSDKKELLFKKN